MRSTLKFLLAVSSIRLVYRYLLPKWDYQSQLNRLPFILELIIATLTHTYTHTHTQKREEKKKIVGNFYQQTICMGKRTFYPTIDRFFMRTISLFTAAYPSIPNMFSLLPTNHELPVAPGAKKEKKKITSTFVRKNFVRPPTGYKTTLWSKKKKRMLTTTQPTLLFYSIPFYETIHRTIHLLCSNNSTFW